MRNVAIVYHFFAHYRGPVISELLKSKENTYILYGDNIDRANSGIKEWKIPRSINLTFTKTHIIKGRFLFQKELLRLACRQDIDVIIYLGDAQFITTWLSAIVGRLLHKRILFWTQGWTRNDTVSKRLIRNSFYRLAHGLLLYGNRAKSIGIRHGFKSENLYVIYNSLDYEVQKSYREKVTKQRILEVKAQVFGDSSTPVVICTSRIVKERKLEQLFKAVSYLKAEGIEVNILLVGSGPEQQILEDLASKLELQVVFFGECYDEKILSELIMAADATVSPGRMGLTAIHSLAYGTPVIAHNNFDQQVPEVEAIIPGENGDLFRQDDYIDLAYKIKKWIRTDLPKEIVRNNCIQIIEKYYNARYQAKIIDQAISGLPARDLYNTNME